jgi:hypothetical protein
MKLALRTLNYLYDTKNLSLFIKHIKFTVNIILIECYCNPSWADNYDYKTTMGHIILLNGCTMVFKYKQIQDKPSGLMRQNTMR